MLNASLNTDDGLRAACAALDQHESWSEERREWVRKLAQDIECVRAADLHQRQTHEFQHRLWEENHVAALGQGNISVDRALADSEFRTWLAQQSTRSLPESKEARQLFLEDFFSAMKARLARYVSRTPQLKMFRVLALLYPEAMTTVGSAGALHELVQAMGGGRGVKPVERHLWVRSRLDEVLGAASDDATSLAERMSLPWMLFERFVESRDAMSTVEAAAGDAGQTRLVPLPPERRRRGVTAIRGGFQGVLAALEFVRDGRTREELVAFLKASSPDAKDSSLAVNINVLATGLDVIQLEDDRYSLTRRGLDVLESQDPTELADWLLTSVLGPDRAIVELRDRGPLPHGKLVAAIQEMNPAWASGAMPQAIVSWLSSMGVISSEEDRGYVLTELGQRWAALIHWTPEPLPREEPPRLPLPPRVDVLVLPPAGQVLEQVAKAGYFPPSVVARLHAGLWSNPRRHFAILTGLSGSGKTLLAREYGKAIVADGARQMFVLPVQPGWYDPGALLGFANPLRGDSYVRTPFLEFLMAASGDPERPYVVILDEMNLSHPEQYMAPLLSTMETGGAIQLHTEDDYFDGVPASIPYPSNLAIIGTINMDETTHGLSDKILDRAFVIEFWEVDLDAYPRWRSRSLPEADEDRAREVLVDLMSALLPARLHFGWRVVDDVLDFLAKASDSDGHLPFTDALDIVVYSKILPKLRGEDSPRFRAALESCQSSLVRHGLKTSAAKVRELAYDVTASGSARFWR